MSKYADQFKDPRWQKKRLEILERDEWMCRMCSSNTETLNVHHKYYSKNIDPWDYPEDSLVTLCNSCHAYEHNAIKTNADDLIQILKENGFMGDDIYYLSEFISSLHFVHVVEVQLSALSHFLKDRSVVEEIVKNYFKHIGELAEITTGE